MLNKIQVDCDAENAFSTIRVKRSTLKKCWLYRRILGLRSLDELLDRMMGHPDMLSWLVDRYRKTAFELGNLGLSSEGIESPRTKLVRKDE